MVTSPGGDEPVVREYDWTTDSPSYAVLDAIACFESSTALRMAAQLSPPLEKTMDTDAFDALIRNSPAPDISFRYADYHVQITNDTVAIS